MDSELDHRLPEGRNSPGLAPVDWEAALAQHERWLRAVIFARVREPHAVDEVMQEVALSAVRQKAPLQDPGKVAPWLYRLAVLSALMYRRKLGRRRKWLKRYGDQKRNDAPAEPNPLDWLLAAERDEILHTALRALPAKDAEILLLKYGQDWSYQEISDHLGISFSAVQTRLHRARHRLREELRRLSQSAFGDGTSGPANVADDPC
ncbi:sigma-70 family RNA polymerase sigma factor [Thermogutta sp.]|uniref:sigma-70 family RNA polymerase sigma factor n=1 Tax=Thermogutta sp. TaxID=1962930 RepID=UPI0032203FF5